MADDTYAGREKSLAMRTSKANREELVSFYRDMAAMGEKPIPPKILQADSSDKVLLSAESLLKSRFSAAPKDAEARDLAVSRFALALFLIERTRALRLAAVKRNHAGLFSLMITLRDEVRDLVDERYYSLSMEEIAANYSDLEPLLFVLSDGLGLPLPSPGEIMKEYRKKAASMLG